jgi:Protein of unknown function (DUF559)/AbiEi antitoxin C-terminal domain
VAIFTERVIHRGRVGESGSRTLLVMPRAAAIPPSLRFAPFRGSVAVARGLITQGQLAGPAWRRLFHDVYLYAEAPVDDLARCHAAALILPPGGALSHESAASLFGVNAMPIGPPRVHVTVPIRCRMRPQPGLVVHRRCLPAVDVARRGGLPVTAPARLAFDLGRHEDRVRAVVGLDALLYQRVLRPHALPDVAADRCGWPGVGRFREAATLTRPHVESPMETRLRLTVMAGGLPEPVVQHEVRDRSGRVVGRLDLAYDDIRVGLEYDGEHHRERVTFQRDAVRLNRLRLMGWTVLRFTADDVLRHPERVVAHVRAALRIAG